MLSKPPDRVKYTNLALRKPDFEEIEALGREAGILKGTAHFEDYTDASFVKDESAVQPYAWEPPTKYDERGALVRLLANVRSSTQRGSIGRQPEKAIDLSGRVSRTQTVHARILVGELSATWLPALFLTVGVSRCAGHIAICFRHRSTLCAGSSSSAKRGCC